MKKVLLSAVAALSLATSTHAQNVPNYVPANGLVGWWPFNGNATDESINTNDGTVNGATLTIDRFGNANSAYSFDGISNYINVGNDPNLKRYQTNFSISAWILPSQFSSLYNQSIVSNRTDNNCGSKFGIGGSWNQIQGLLEFEINGGITSDYVFSNKQLSNSHFQHVCITNNFQTNKNIVKLYVNGRIVNSDTIIGTMCDPNNQNTYIGYESYSNPNNSMYFKGTIDDIGIWNRALTQQEISNLYNANICYDHVTVTDTLVINTNITGFNPITYQNTIKVFPNPSNDHITIHYGNYANLNGYQLKITNSLGQQMFQTAITQQSSFVDLKTWTGNGIYFVHIIDAQGNTVDIKKIVLQ